jgi:hypothetical protein
MVAEPEPHDLPGIARAMDLFASGGQLRLDLAARYPDVFAGLFISDAGSEVVAVIALTADPPPELARYVEDANRQLRHDPPGLARIVFRRSAHRWRDLQAVADDINARAPQWVQQGLPAVAASVLDTENRVFVQIASGDTSHDHGLTDRYGPDVLVLHHLTIETP